MKARNLQKFLAAGVISALLAVDAFAQDSSNAPAVSAAAAPQLSYGVPQVLQLAQAKIGDDTIIAYVKNSGTIYSLDANQIVYLKQQGVSDKVITAMLEQRQNVTGTTAEASSAAQQSSSAETSTAVAQPTVTYQTVPSSTVYVVPDTQTYNYDAWYYSQPYYPAYYPYYGWPYPAVTFSIGGYWGGGHFHDGGFHGGGRSGWHR